jgi:hypothetical protein
MIGATRQLTIQAGRPSADGRDRHFGRAGGAVVPASGSTITVAVAAQS